MPTSSDLIDNDFHVCYDEGISPGSRWTEDTAQRTRGHASNCTEEWIRSDFGEGTEYLLAMADGEAVGCVAYRILGEGAAEAERLAVVPAHREDVGVFVCAHPHSNTGLTDQLKAQQSNPANREVPIPAWR